MYTPGPWKIASNGKNGKTFRIWRNDTDNTDETNRGYACIAPHVHGEANARLLAASPDLLGVLEMIKAEYGYSFDLDTNQRIDAAIAKATGGQP